MWNIEFSDYLSSYLSLQPRNFIICLDMDFKIIAASSYALNYLGTTVDNIVGKNFQILASNHPKLKNNSILKEFELYLSPDRDIDLNINWELLPVGNKAKQSGWVLRKKIGNGENQLEKNSLGYLEKISTVMPGNFYWKDSEGHYLGCNQALLEALDFSETDIIGKTDWDLWPEQAKKLRQHDCTVIRTKKLIRLQENVTLEDGQHFYSVIKIPLYSDEGKVIGVVGNSLDITEQIMLQEQLSKEKEKLEFASRTKSDFIANMSHDLRTPLTGITGMLHDLLQSASGALTTLDTAPPPPLMQQSQRLRNLATRVKTHSKVALGSSEELLRLCNEVLDVMQLESHKKEVKQESFEPRRVIQRNLSLLQSVAEHKKLNLSATIDDAIPHYLYGPAQYFDRIMLNLLSNALKFTEQGFVKIDVTLANKKKCKKHYQKGDCITLQLAIEDSGIGIPKDKLEAIFEHFSRLAASYEGKYSGSGLGLYTVKQYVSAMKGHIEVASEISKGSCFTLRLPFAVDDQADSALAETPKTLPPTPTTAMSTIDELPLSSTVATNQPGSAEVLIVEDNKVAGFALQVLLQSMKCNTDLAKDGASAVERVIQNIYDLIFMDIGLPDQSGIEVTKAIRALPDRRHSSVAKRAHAMGMGKIG